MQASFRLTPSTSVPFSNACARRSKIIRRVGTLAEHLDSRKNVFQRLNEEVERSYIHLVDVRATLSSSSASLWTYCC